MSGKSYTRFLSCLLLAVFSTFASADEGTDFFESKIRPVLVENCYQCHSEKAQQQGKLKGGLLLDTRAGIRKGGDSGPAVVPRNADDSELLAAIRHESFEMPPKGKLPDDVISDFEKWIELGAPDPRDGMAVVREETIDVAASRGFWSFRPLQPVTVPVARSKWSRTDIDGFVEAKRDEAGLQPVSDARPRVLIRRLYFDLVGLVPSPGEVEQFEQAAGRDRQAAIEQLVDRLLDSPHFGERWGRHWLDVARFGETGGGTKNADWPDAWRYRDYVIRSLNDDKPYDQFIREQIAGDLLENQPDAEGSFNGEPKASVEKASVERPSVEDQSGEHRRLRLAVKRFEGIVATGFLAMGANKSNSTRMEVIGEQLDTVGRAVLGIAIGCARCHDHKFDPIPTSDFYAMAGIFANSDPQDQSGHVSRGRHLAELEKKQINIYKDYVNELKKHNSAIAKGRERIAELLAKQGFRLPLGRLTASRRRQRTDSSVNAEALHTDAFGLPLNEWAEAISRLEGNNRKKAEDSLADIESATDALEKLCKSGLPDVPIAIAVEETGVRGKFRNTQIHIRGNEDVLGDEVPRNALQMLTAQPLEIGADESGRRQLAKLIATHPLTARVMVNRIWHHLFGRGLVKTVDNFGALGERPSHPQLLEFLSRQFVESNWSVKSLVRQVVLSRSYQLAADESEAAMDSDPENRLLWRHAPRRRDAEAMRDAILTAAGTLDLIAPDPWQQLNYHSFGRDTLASTRIRHRAVYLPVMRGFPSDVFAAFNFPPPDLVVGRRETSSVPTQALFMINSPLVMEQSQYMAQRLLNDEGKDPKRVALAYKLTLGREPTGDEVKRSFQLIDRWKSDADDPRTALDGWAALCQALFCSAEFRYVE